MSESQYVNIKQNILFTCSVSLTKLVNLHVNQSLR